MAYCAKSCLPKVWSQAWRAYVVGENVFVNDIPYSNTSGATGRARYGAGMLKTFSFLDGLPGLESLIFESI